MTSQYRRCIDDQKHMSLHVRMQDTTLTIRVSKEWLAKLDAWRKQQPVPPGRSDVIRVAVDRLIAAYEKPEQETGK
jgi:hypothetical protein